MSHHKVDIALTAVSFVPGLGQAAWAYRGYRAYRAYRVYRTARYTRYASRACRVNSFAPDTRVPMADGTTRDIDDIAVGDLVLAADPDTGETRAEPVTDLIIGSGEKDLVTITADPDGDGRQYVLHPHGQDANSRSQLCPAGEGQKLDGVEQEFPELACGQGCCPSNGEPDDRKLSRSWRLQSLPL